CMGSTTARGSSAASLSTVEDVAFSSSELDRHLGIRPVSQLNTQPVVTPVNASRLASRPGSRITRGPGGWLDLSLQRTYTSYSSASLTGALAFGTLARPTKAAGSVEK